jgi:hypothetical protein
MDRVHSEWGSVRKQYRRWRGSGIFCISSAPLQDRDFVSLLNLGHEFPNSLINAGVPTPIPLTPRAGPS